MQNFMQMHNKMQQVPSVIVREGEESMNKEIPDRYLHSNDWDVHSQHHSMGSPHGKVTSKIHHKHGPK